MNRPPFTDYMIGNPVVLIALGLLSLASIYFWWVDRITWLACGLVLVVTHWSSRAFGRIDAYRSWKREWDSMGGSTPSPGTARRWLRRMGAVLTLALVASFLYANRQDPTYLTGLTWMGICLGIGGFIWLIRLRRKARPMHQIEALDNPVVRIVPTRPLLDVPPLSVAYRRLPPHCHRALQQAQLSDQAR